MTDAALDPVALLGRVRERLVRPPSCDLPHVDVVAELAAARAALGSLPGALDLAGWAGWPLWHALVSAPDGQDRRRAEHLTAAIRLPA